MSIVAVHGPNTFGTTQGGGQSIPSSGGGIAQATKDPTNGLKFSFSVPNPGARPAADFDWTFTGPGSPAAQNDKHSGTVTFTGAGAVTIVCTVAAGAGPPAGGTYTVSATATAGTPRSLPPGGGGDEEEQPEGESTLQVGFDPAAHNVEEVKAYAEEHPDDVAELLEAEEAGKNRSSLVSFLGELLPYDPADYSVAEVVEYAEANPEYVDDLIASEQEGKNRSTLISHLEGLRE